MFKFYLPIRLMVWLGIVLLAAVVWGSGWPGKILQQKLVASNSYVHGAWFWNNSCHGVVCNLCPKKCFLPEGMKGYCRVRVNMGGRLYTLVYGRPAAVHIDPIEKKPVFHLLPGSRTFSLATAGCNLSCDFCQNWSLSQGEPEALPFQRLLPQQIVSAARQYGCSSIAYTYSEPVVFYEYMAETARLAKQAGLYNVVITGAYINPEPLKRLLPDLDVVKIDLKGFDRKYYRQVVGGSLEPVLKALEIVANSGVQLEVVNLVVPGRNDSPEQLALLCRWVRDKLGPETPLFFSRFMPCYRMPNYPKTPVSELRNARNMALREGLKYVYLGNVTGDEGENTYCPNCGFLLIRRVGYAVLYNKLKHGHCPRCREAIPGIWEHTRRPVESKGE
jgi:pyruvate formate lyase activating enzyme